MSRTGAGLVRAGALHIPLQDNSVDLIVTSPPYFMLRNYEDQGEHVDDQIGAETTYQRFLEALWAVTAECWRVLKPAGSMWVNLGDKYSGTGGGGEGSSDGLTGRHARPPRRGSDVPTKSLMGLPWRYAIGCIDGKAAPPVPRRCALHAVLSCPLCREDQRQQWIVRAEVVWSKPNGLPESVTDRVWRTHETWFHMSKEGSYFSATDEIREPLGAWAEKARQRSDAGDGGRGKRGLPGYEDINRSTWEEGNPLGKLPGSVWEIAAEPLNVPDWLEVDHFAPFPQEWPRRLILGWSPSGVCVECGEGRRPIADKEATGEALKRNLRHIPGYEDPAGEGQRDVRYEIIGYACACTPRTSHRGKRGDWKEGRREEPEKNSADWHSPGNAVPRRPGGFGTKVPPPEKPMWEYHFEDWTPPPTRQAVVLDPFVGTGTTVMVARALGRYGVGIDLSADYLRLAQWRVFDSGHASKTVQRTWQERQGSLL